jgi:hypothetical protein
MPRPLVWVSGGVLLVLAIAGLVAFGSAGEPASEPAAHRVVVRSAAAAPPSFDSSRDPAGPGTPEVVVLGDVAPAAAARAPAPARRSARREVVEVVYVDGPAPRAEELADPDPAPLAAPAVEAYPEPAAYPEPEVASAPAPAPRTAPARAGSSRTGAIVTGAAVGAGVGAIFGGGRGALRGAIGGAAGGAIGGRTGGVLGGVLGGASGRGRTGGSTCPRRASDVLFPVSS